MITYWLVSEACHDQAPRVPARVSIECHWLACTGSHLAGNHHTTAGVVSDIGHTYGLSYVCGVTV